MILCDVLHYLMTFLFYRVAAIVVFDLSRPPTFDAVLKVVILILSFTLQLINRNPSIYFWMQRCMYFHFQFAFFFFLLSSKIVRTEPLLHPHLVQTQTLLCVYFLLSHIFPYYLFTSLLFLPSSSCFCWTSKRSFWYPLYIQPFCMDKASKYSSLTWITSFSSLPLSNIFMADSFYFTPYLSLWKSISTFYAFVISLLYINFFSSILQGRQKFAF